MAHSIELLFDEATDARIRRIWDAIAAAGIRSQAAVTAPTNRPHVTLAVADHIDAKVDVPLRALADRLPVACVVGAPLVFGGGPFTLARLVVASSALLALHAEVHAVSLPYVAPGPAPHTMPGQWTPHVTLCRRVNADRLAGALGAAGALSGDWAARLVGLRRWDGQRRVDHILVS